VPLQNWGDWALDTTDYEARTAKTIVNVAPRADAYGPFPNVRVWLCEGHTKTQRDGATAPKPPRSCH
jgi:hypothetical protein